MISVEEILAGFGDYRKHYDKTIFRFSNQNGAELEIVFKDSDRHEDKFLFAVFHKIENRWICIERGFHKDMGRVKRYLYAKYVRQRKGVSI